MSESLFRLGLYLVWFLSDIHMSGGAESDTEDDTRSSESRVHLDQNLNGLSNGLLLAASQTAAKFCCWSPQFVALSPERYPSYIIQRSSEFSCHGSLYQNRNIIQMYQSAFLIDALCWVSQQQATPGKFFKSGAVRKPTTISKNLSVMMEMV